MLDPPPPDAAANLEAVEAAEQARATRLRMLADAVRLIYVMAVRQHRGDMDYGKQPMATWDGGVDAWGRTHRPIWPRLARFMMAHEVDPATYIYAQFSYAPRMPLPNQLMNDDALQRYRQFKEHRVETLRQLWERSLVAVQCEVRPLVEIGHWPYHQALRYALANTRTVSAPAIFRVCLAASEGLTDVVEFFYPAAMADYVFQQTDYDTAWGERIPASLQVEAKQLRVAMSLTKGDEG